MIPGPVLRTPTTSTASTSCRVCTNPIAYEPVPTEPITETVMFTERVCRVHARMSLAALDSVADPVLGVRMRPPIFPHDAEDIISALFGVIT